jgi:hypothetical protein
VLATINACGAMVGGNCCQQHTWWREISCCSRSINTHRHVSPRCTPVRIVTPVIAELTDTCHPPDVELQTGDLVTVEPYHVPSSPPSADHVGRDWSPWRVLETPILSTLTQTFAAGPDLPLELIPPALSRALWICGLTSLAVSVIHSVVRVGVLEHQRALWPWLFMQRNAFLLLPILGITVPALEWIITCLQNARLWALFHTQQQTPVTREVEQEHVLNIDHEPSAKYEDVPGGMSIYGNRIGTD